MENTHPNVTLRKGETLPGEEITHDNLSAETTALPNTSQPLVLSQAQDRIGFTQYIYAAEHIDGTKLSFQSVAEVYEILTSANQKL